jgi:CRP/FNR family transcriptional regulator, cyclic AMP receptor protein
MDPDGPSALSAGAAPLALDQTELFAGVRAEVLERIAAKMAGGAYRAGVVVAREGTPGDCLYVIGQGLVEIVMRLGSPEERRIATLGPGGFFGEMSLIENRVRGASVRTIEPSIIYSLRPADLNDVALDEPHQCRMILINIARGLSRRLREMDEQFAARSY